MSNYETQEDIMAPVDITVTQPLGVGFGSIHAPEMTDAQAELDARELLNFRRKIDWRNPAVCFDGRVRIAGQNPLPLGPHLAGGFESVVVAAKSVDHDLQGADIVADLKDKGFSLGGHDDDTNLAANYASGTGCGACDKCEGSTTLFNENKADVEPIAQAMSGSYFDKPTYDGSTLKPVTAKSRDVAGDELTETLHDDGQGVHGHTEWSIFLEYEDGVSFDRDAYFEATGKKVFPIQMWYLKRLADAMATGSNPVEHAKQVYNALVNFQIATYIGLADGSHRAIIAQPQQEPVAA